ncbi:MAG: glycosyltransferase [Chitinophagales bacterium]
MALTQPILLITPGFPKEETDDTCIPFLQDYLMALAAAIGKKNVQIITLQYPFSKKIYYWNGMEVYSAGGKNRKGVFRLLAWYRAKSIAGKWIQPGKTIIHAFWLTEATYIGTKLAKKYNCKMVSTIMGQDVLPANKYLPRIKQQNTYIVAPNKKAADTLYHTAHIYTGKIITPAVKNIPLLKTNRNTDILFVGAFIPLKQPELFVEIVQQITLTHPAIKCSMIGQGVLMDIIKNMVAKENITQIELTGQLNREEVLHRMQQAKILLHTSAYEGHATVFSEALACGMHIVSFDVGGPLHPQRHICTTTNGMIEKIQQLLSSPITFKPDQSHTINQVARQYLEIYQSLES